jgi:uncharacterized protein (DUF4415 family)
MKPEKPNDAYPKRGRPHSVPMNNTYDFARGNRGAVLSSAGKTRITVYLDNKTLQQFKTESERTGKGYHTLISEALSQYSERPARGVINAEVEIFNHTDEKTSP